MVHAALRIAALAALYSTFWLGSDAAPMDRSLQNPCESPSVAAGSFHVVIAGYESKTCFTQYLWDLGLTNAQVFVYRRVGPEVPLRHWHGPCGMAVQEKLLLPNWGRDAAAFFSYVTEFYDRQAETVLFMHGHGPHAYHTNCETIMGRARLYYRGLAMPFASNPDVEFSRHMVTLTRFSKGEDDFKWLRGFSEEDLMRRGRLQEEDKPTEGELMDAAKGRCYPLFAKWSVNITQAGFYTCCATFILPWERILRYPKGFYTEFLRLVQAEKTMDNIYGKQCFEFQIWAFYQEPEMSPEMAELYLKASHIALEYNTSRCQSYHGEPNRDC